MIETIPIIDKITESFINKSEGIAILCSINSLFKTVPFNNINEYIIMQNEYEISNNVEMMLIPIPNLFLIIGQLNSSLSNAIY